METGATPALRTNEPRKTSSVRLSFGTRLGTFGMFGSFKTRFRALGALTAKLGSFGTFVSWLGPSGTLRT